MTNAVISNPFFNQKFQEILQHVFNNQHLDSKSHGSYVSGCREIMVLIKNVVRCYSLDISYLLITNLNLLPNLLPFIDPERLYF
jgi:RNA-binding protein YlmH